jgi:hypothetical protein
VKRRAPSLAPRTRCPTCGSPTPWSGNAQRPFCSLSCRLVDLGVWLDERYRIPGRELSRAASLDERAGPDGG